MTRLVALVPAAVCAAALGREWPHDLDSQVRCIDEGARSLRLTFCCPPRSHEAQDPDTVTAGLVRTPGALPVLGMVTGPGSAGLAAGEVGGSPDRVQDHLDDASDTAVERLRALSACGVRRAAVVEDANGSTVSHDALREAHRPLLNAGAHLRLDLVLVASGPGATEWSDYDWWVSDQGCSPELGFLPREAFDSRPELERGLDRLRAGSGAAEVITAPLDDAVSPDLLRHASRVLSGEDPRP